MTTNADTQPEASDAELIAQARGGNDAAFRILVERHQGAVASVVIGMLGAGDDADDVGQETFIRFHKSMDQFRGDASLSTYLRRIAMNLSLNALKRRKRSWTRFISRDQAPDAVNEPAIEPADPEQKERTSKINAAVATLNDKHRAVVVLRLIDGLSTNETADILGIPPGTVMSRLSRSVAELKTLLTPYVQGTAQ